MVAVAMHSIDRELARHASALRSLALDLVGEHAADDVVQDTAVEALRAPPRRPGPLGGWLAGIVRHIASRHRRGQRRRKAREGRAARAELVPPDDTAGDRELFQRLTAAVMALPEPYQGAVLRRYLRERTPAEIARETGVPVATVKTRLQRGLALLRQRLARDGAEWRLALCATFGIDTPLPLAATTFTPIGVLFMGTGAKLGLGCAVLAIAAALWWGLYSESATALSTAASGNAQAREAGALTGGAATPAPNERQELVVSAGTEPDAERRVVVRGRCVDEQGEPLPRCEVELRGRKLLEGGPDLRREYGEWLVAHPDRVFRDLTMATDAGGRFEFAFDCVPLGYQLRLRRDVVNHLVRIGTLQARQDKDLGDIVLPACCEVHGRVVDTGGAPVVARVFVWQRSERPLDATQTVEHVNATRPDPDGTFWASVVAGDYELALEEGREIVRGTELAVPPRCTQLDVEVVVAAGSANDTISGIVIGEQGQPEPGVRISIMTAPRPWHAMTDAAGRFTLWRPRGMTAEQVSLFWNSNQALVRWGNHDVRLTGRREPDGRRDVALRIVTALGVPVTDYQIYECDAQRDSGLTPEVTRALGGHHPDGLVLLRGIAKWPLCILVDPDRADLWQATVSIPGGTSSQQIEVRLPSASQRLLRVLHPDGSTAEGVVVEQIATGTGSFSLATPVWALSQWPSKHSHLLMQSSRTDARGQVHLRGPVDGTIAVRLPGPPGLLLREVRFDTEEILVVTLPRGARLEGRLGPPALVRELRLALAWPAEGPVQPVSGRSPIGFRLQRGKGQDEECVPLAQAGMAMVDGDGSFAIDGVPPGTWTLMFGGADDHNRAGQDRPEPVQDVELRAGETTRVTLDLPDRGTGELAGQILMNGKPMASRKFMVMVGERRRATSTDEQATDAEGRFRLRMRQGTARVLVSEMLFQEGLGLWSMWRAPEEVFVPAGSSVSQVFHFERGKVRLCVLANDGSPRMNVALLLRGDDGRLHQTTTSAMDGWLSVEAEPQPFTVQVLPRSVKRAAGQISSWVVDRMLWSLPTADPFAGQWLTVGRVTPKAGETVELEVRLPPEWDR